MIILFSWPSRNDVDVHFILLPVSACLIAHSLPPLRHSCCICLRSQFLLNVSTATFTFTFAVLVVVAVLGWWWFVYIKLLSRWHEFACHRVLTIYTKYRLCDRIWIQGNTTAYNNNIVEFAMEQIEVCYMPTAETWTLHLLSRTWAIGLWLYSSSSSSPSSSKQLCLTAPIPGI